MTEKVFSELFDILRNRKPKEKINEILEKFELLFNTRPQDSTVLYFLMNFGRFENSIFLDLSTTEKAILFKKINRLNVDDPLLLPYQNELSLMCEVGMDKIGSSQRINEMELSTKSPNQTNINNNNMIKENPEKVNKTPNNVETLTKNIIQNGSQINTLETPINLEKSSKSNGSKTTPNTTTITPEPIIQSNYKGTSVEKSNKKSKIEVKIRDKIEAYKDYEGKSMIEFVKYLNDDRELFNNGLFIENILNENVNVLLEIGSETIMKFISLYMKITFMFKTRQLPQVKNLFGSYLSKCSIPQESINLILSVPVACNINSYIFKDENESRNTLNIEENKIEENYKLYCYNKVYNFLDSNQKDFICFIVYIYIKQNIKEKKVMNNLIFYKKFLDEEVIQMKNIECLKIKQNKLYMNDSNIEDLQIDFDFLNKDEFDKCEFVLSYLKKHFSLDKNSYYKLLKVKNMVYIKDIIAMLNFYISLEKRSVDIKGNLEKVEKVLIENFQSAKKKYENCLSKCTNKFSKDFHIKTLEELKQKITREIKANDIVKNIKFNIIPFGSVVQFLGKIDSDLDLALIIDSNSPKVLKIFWSIVDNLIFREIDKNKEIILTARLFTIKFTQNKLKVDLNYFGACGILNSTLIRYYSLIDVRFQILVYNIKKIMKDLGVTNDDDRKEFLNSYSWVLLIITFLQEYLPVPVLPKLIDNRMIPHKIQVFNFEKKKRSRGKMKDFEEICDKNQFREEAYELYKFPINYEEIYKEFRKENKNNQSVAELFVKLIEFIGYLFKYDSLFFDFKNQKIENKKNYDRELILKEEKKDKKNYFLVTDPFDHTYNPAKDLKNTQSAKKFFDTLRSLLKRMLEEGKI